MVIISNLTNSQMHVCELKDYEKIYKGNLKESWGIILQGVFFGFIYFFF